MGAVKRIALRESGGHEISVDQVTEETPERLSLRFLNELEPSNDNVHAESEIAYDRVRVGTPPPRSGRRCSIVGRIIPASDRRPPGGPPNRLASDCSAMTCRELARPHSCIFMD
jgi:hypothetical protein